jgi:imidazoleglycerol phosphate dehydratase HisB
VDVHVDVDVDDGQTQKARPGLRFLDHVHSVLGTNAWWDRIGRQSVRVRDEKHP